MIKFVVGVTMKLYLFTFMLFSQLLIASVKNDRDNIKRTLVEYLQSIDQKNASRISEHFYFDRRGWDRGPVFCFGEGTTREFSDWMSSNPFSKSGQMNNQKHTTLT